MFNKSVVDSLFLKISAKSKRYFILACQLIIIIIRHQKEEEKGYTV